MPLTPLIGANEMTRSSANRIIDDRRFSLAEPALKHQQYTQGHIASSYYLDLDLEQGLSDEVTATTGRHSLPRIDDFTSAQ